MWANTSWLAPKPRALGPRPEGPLSAEALVPSPFPQMPLRPQRVSMLGGSVIATAGRSGLFPGRGTGTQGQTFWMPRCWVRAHAGGPQGAGGLEHSGLQECGQRLPCAGCPASWARKRLPSVASGKARSFSGRPFPWR